MVPLGSCLRFCLVFIIVCWNLLLCFLPEFTLSIRLEEAPFQGGLKFRIKAWCVPPVEPEGSSPVAIYRAPLYTALSI